MTDGIGRISGGNSYGVGGYIPNRKEEDVAPQAAVPQPAVDNEESKVDPSKVMDFLANNNIFVGPVSKKAPAELDPAVRERIEGYMENFEMFYGLVVQEFGEELAPQVMDLCMDLFMDMAA